MTIKPPSYKADCKHFRGDVPCKPHKDHGYHCESCPQYDKKKNIILIIKLGAIGDVIRTTALLHNLWKENPQSSIWWLTYSPDVVPGSVDRIMGFTLESILAIRATHFAKVINLDKDIQACGLASVISTDELYGFTLKNGKPAPANALAEHKFLTGLFDDVNQQNEKSYLEEIFEICDFKFTGEEYILDCDTSITWNIPNRGKKIIGLNTGCGGRWTTRLWSDENWLALIDDLQKKDYFPMILGGEQEHEKNTELAQISGAYYPGYFSLKEFISLVNYCSAVVTAVTMAMHIVIGLKKPVVLMNNIFNPKEFELYGRGEIIQPAKPCICFFSPKCKNPDYFCMDHLSVESISTAIDRIFV